MSKKFTKEIGGKVFSIELGKLAGQTNGAALITLGGTTVLVTCVMGRKERDGIDYFPLLVDYEEKLYAAGKIKGSRFIKREGRATDEAILTGRIIDRTIRPRFNQKMRNDIQVVATVLSFDRENDPDVIAIIGASVALSISDIPWDGPLAATRVCRYQDQWVINPSYEVRAQSGLDFIVSGSADRINMLEGGACEIAEPLALEGIKLAQEYIKLLIDFQKEIIADLKPQKKEIIIKEADAQAIGLIKNFLNGKLEEVLYEKDKVIRQAGLGKLKEALFTYLKEQPLSDLNTTLKTADILYEVEINDIVHKNILETGKRPDGRKLDELRELRCEINILPQTHGSAIFERGTTQSLSIVTLGAPGDEQIIDDMEIETKKRFFHHYNFPPFSVGEIGPFRGPGRREIGHGALAERALEKILPPKEEFPYTIRVVSEILSSNGSSSMASACASSLALMAAGVPVKTAVAGIAMGLMTAENSDDYKVLTDIQGPEDHHGDMDLKVAGTSQGICSIQMDVKIQGVNLKMLEDAFNQAKKARLEILDKMNEAISAPHPELSANAPRIISYRINPDQIREVIGPGGKIINEIIDQTGAEIDIEDDGLIFITAKNKESAEKALTWIKNITREIMAGEIFQGKVVKIMDFGAFIELLPKQDGLLHISEMGSQRINRVEDVMKVGDSVSVKVKSVDDLGRINLVLANKTNQ